LQALSLVSRSTDPEPIASLEFHRSLMRRRQAHVLKYERRRGSPWPSSLTQALQALSAAPSSKILLLKASQFIAPAQDAAVDIVDWLRDAKVPVFWMMAPACDDAPIQVSDIIRTLLAQVLDNHSNVFKADAPFPLTLAHMQSAQADSSQWPQILARAISNIAPQIFLVIECSALLCDDTASRIQNLVTQLEKVCEATAGTQVKVVVADRHYLHRLHEAHLSMNVSLLRVDPRRDVRRARVPHRRLQSSHLERTRAIQRGKVVFTMPAAVDQPKEEEDEWV
jgi:hypothetical protein